MAKYFVLEAHQAPTDRPHRHVKKSAGITLLRQNLAKRIAHNIIQLIAIREAVQVINAERAQVFSVAQETYEVRATRLRELNPCRVQKVNNLKSPEGLLIHYPIAEQRTVNL